MVDKYAVLDEAIEQLKAYEKTSEADSGIRYLVSGGSMESMNEWYRNMEAARTPEQRATEITQKLAREEYNKAKEKAMPLIKAAQSKKYPEFAIPDYENTWRTFRAPNMELAKKFLMIQRNSTKWLPEIVKANTIKPVLEKLL